MPASAGRSHPSPRESGRPGPAPAPRANGELPASAPQARRTRPRNRGPARLAAAAAAAAIRARPRWGPRRTTRRPRSRSRPGMAPTGTARPRARTGPSTRRSTRTPASMVPSTLLDGPPHVTRVHASRRRPARRPARHRPIAPTAQLGTPHLPDGEQTPVGRPRRGRLGWTDRTRDRPGLAGSPGHDRRRRPARRAGLDRHPPARRSPITSRGGAGLSGPCPNGETNLARAGRATRCRRARMAAVRVAPRGGGRPAGWPPRDPASPGYRPRGHALGAATGLASVGGLAAVVACAIPGVAALAALGIRLRPGGPAPVALVVLAAIAWSAGAVLASSGRLIAPPWRATR